ncbi:MAG: hypothetical protein OXE87_08510 [Chloroflexi bacterium]|nr:hypothetical protein [Chloroflexota bacterium]
MRLGWNAPASVCSSLVLLVVAVMVVMACGGEPAPALPTATVIPPAQAVAPYPAPTYTPLPTYTPYPTYTRVPTATPDPTATPEPAATPVPTPTLTPADRDRAALIALYESTNGSGWTNRANWVSDAPVEQWHGVTVDGKGRVIELSLQRNQLLGELPSELGELSELRNLRLWSNDLSGTIPSELSQLTQLEQFAVGGNRLHGTIPDWLSGLHNLSNLHLTTNRFTGPLPAWLGDLPLRRLILGKNRFEGDIPEELGNLRGLSALWLGGNNLTGCIPDSLRYVSDNDFAASGVPFCADDSLASAPEVTPTPQPTATPSPTATASTTTPETALPTRPEPPEVWYFDDPEVPYLKWEIGPEVPEEQYEYARSGILDMHRYAVSLELPPLPDDATFYLYGDHELAARTIARVERRHLEDARRKFTDDGWAGLAGLEPENEDSGWIMLNLQAFIRYPESWRYMRTASHELSHVYQYSLQGHGRFDTTHREVRVIGPAWMQEGFATWHSDRALPMGGIIPYEQSRDRLIRQSQRVDVQLNETETYDGLKAGPGRYDMAAMASELLAAEAGEEALIEFWTLLRPGNPWEQAFESTFGMTIDEFYELFEEHRAAGFPELDLPDIAPRVPLAEVDREALTALYQSTNGGNWENNDNWLSDAPGNRWHGVTTDLDGHVVVLDLRDNRLNGEIPPALGDLVNLRELRLRENQLRGAIPPELGKLANLEVLSLVHNRLDGPIPPELGNLPNLKQFAAWSNQLSGEIPSSFANAVELTQFAVGGNRMTGQKAGVVWRFARLARLAPGRQQVHGDYPRGVRKADQDAAFQCRQESADRGDTSVARGLPIA